MNARGMCHFYPTKQPTLFTKEERQSIMEYHDKLLFGAWISTYYSQSMFQLSHRSILRKFYCEQTLDEITYYTTLIKCLIKDKNIPNLDRKCYYDAQTLAHKCARMSSLQALILIITSNKSDPQHVSKTDGRTLIQNVIQEHCRHIDLELIHQTLINLTRAGVPINNIDYKGQTATHTAATIAAINQNYDTFNLIVTLGGNVNYITRSALPTTLHWLEKGDELPIIPAKTGGGGLCKLSGGT